MNFSKQNKRWNADRVSAFVWLLFGLSAWYGSIRLGLGTASAPGSGFLPFLASGFISLMALIIFYQSFRKGRNEYKKVSDLWQGVQWRRSVAFCLITIGYLLIFEWLGFAVSTFLFLIALLKGMERLPWWKVLLISTLSTGFAYFLLSVSMQATLPRGIFGI